MKAEACVASNRQHHRSESSDIRKMITDSRTNKVYLAEGLRHYPHVYESLTMVLQQEQIPFQLLHNTKSKKHIWIRDYMPIQLEKDKFLRYVYNPDYLADDTSYIPDYFNLYNKFNHDYLFTDIVLDGGNVIKCGDKVIMTDKIFKENPNYGSDELISTLEDLLQSQLIIIPWDKYEIYGHADGMVRFINGNTVLLNNYINFDTDLRNLLLAVLNNHFDVKELK